MYLRTNDFPADGLLSTNTTVPELWKPDEVWSYIFKQYWMFQGRSQGADPLFGQKVQKMDSFELEFTHFPRICDKKGPDFGLQLPHPHTKKVRLHQLLLHPPVNPGYCPVFCSQESSGGWFAGYWSSCTDRITWFGVWAGGCPMGQRSGTNIKYHSLEKRHKKKENLEFNSLNKVVPPSFLQWKTGSLLMHMTSKTGVWLVI